MIKNLTFIYSDHVTIAVAVKMQLPDEASLSYCLNQNYKQWQQANISNFYQQIK